MGFGDTDKEEESSPRVGISGYKVCSMAFEFWNPALHMQTQICSTTHLSWFAMVFPGIKLCCCCPLNCWVTFCLCILALQSVLFYDFDIFYTRPRPLGLEVDIKSLYIFFLGSKLMFIRVLPYDYTSGWSYYTKSLKTSWSGLTWRGVMKS